MKKRPDPNGIDVENISTNYKVNIDLKNSRKMTAEEIEDRNEIQEAFKEAFINQKEEL